MTPTLLIVGATGNTGKACIRTVSEEAEGSGYRDYRIIGLTRDANSTASKELAKIPKVEMMEKNWSLIDADWLREHEIKRIFIAPFNTTTQFTDESLFHNYALEAGVEYVVRISTTKANVGPATPVYYGRQHWAIETMLEQPEFNAMQWTSLQPNVFTGVLKDPAVAWVKEYKETGKKTVFNTMLDGDNGVAVVDPNEVGIVAGKLLVQKDVSRHASQKYVVVGPSDISGKELVAIVEKYAKTTVDDVSYRDVSFVDGLKDYGYAENILPSLKTAPRSSWDGRCSLAAAPTSEGVKELYTPKNGALQEIEAALAAL